jgi:hypothetical protein
MNSNHNHPAWWLASLGLVAVPVVIVLAMLP